MTSKKRNSHAKHIPIPRAPRGTTRTLSTRILNRDMDLILLIADYKEWTVSHVIQNMVECGLANLLATTPSLAQAYHEQQQRKQQSIDKKRGHDAPPSETGRGDVS